MSNDLALRLRIALSAEDGEKAIKRFQSVVESTLKQIGRTDADLGIIRQLAAEVEAGKKKLAELPAEWRKDVEAIRRAKISAIGDQAASRIRAIGDAASRQIDVLRNAGAAERDLILQTVAVHADAARQKAAEAERGAASMLTAWQRSHNAALDAARASGQDMAQLEGQSVVERQRILDTLAGHYRSVIDQMISETNRHLDAARRADEELSRFKMTTEDRIRALRQRGMDEASAYQDKLRQIDEKQAQGGPIFRRMAGAIRGPGTATSDSIPAMLSSGEFVMRAAAVNRWGLNFLHALNAGMLPAMPVPRFAAGGLVGDAGGAGNSDTVNINLSIGQKQVQLQGARDQAMALAGALRELSRGA